VLGSKAFPKEERRTLRNEKRRKEQERREGLKTSQSSLGRWRNLEQRRSFPKESTANLQPAFNVEKSRMLQGKGREKGKQTSGRKMEKYCKETFARKVASGEKGGAANSCPVRDQPRCTRRLGQLGNQGDTRKFATSAPGQAKI